MEIRYSNITLNFIAFLNPTQDLEVITFSVTGHLYLFVLLNELIKYP